MNFYWQKHRGNSKFSLHGGAVKLSGKHSSVNSSRIPSPVENSANIILESQPSNAGRDCTEPDVRNASESSSFFSEEEAIDDCIHKSVIIEYDIGDSCHTSAVDTAAPSYKLSPDTLNSDNNHVLPKIKWGDLDEGTLVHYGKTSGGEVNFGKTKNDNSDFLNAAKFLPCSKRLGPNQHKLFGVVINEDMVLPESKAVSPKIISTEGLCKEVNEVPSEDVKEQINSEQTVENHECLKPGNDVSFDTLNRHMLHKACEDESTKKASKLKSASGPTICEHSERGTIGEGASADATEEASDKKIQEKSNDILDKQSIDGANAEVTGESKERFRERLWCFLFENLNRAVDELYLLCELECDLDQMKEASLVLEEAALDFRELKSRVEKFEKQKRSLSHETEGASLVLQSDHRRPHALSWEVRILAFFNGNTLYYRFCIKVAI